MMPGPAHSRVKFADEIWQEINESLRDPQMIDEGDPAPSKEAAIRVRGLIETTESLVSRPICHPHVEFFDGSIRLVWTKPTANVVLVVASSDDRPSYVYHATIENGRAVTHETLAPTASNLAHWLDAMEPQGHTAHRY